MIKLFRLRNLVLISVSLFIAYQGGTRIIDTYNTPTYVSISEYDMINSLDCESLLYDIDNVLIERNNNYMLVDLLTNANQINTRIKGLECDMLQVSARKELTDPFVMRFLKDKYSEYIVDGQYSDNNVSDNIHTHFKIEFAKGDERRIIKNLEKATNEKIKSKYFDRERSIIELLDIQSVIPNIVFVIVMIICLNMFAVTGKSELDALMGGSMDYEIISSTDASKTKFDDIEGMIEAKAQIKKFVDIMINREQYAKVGATIPRGVLLCGPPGCGKTLLAKAVAGEANVTFISTSGADFDEKFVGVGASRVRKIFDVAKKCAPAIIYIDEIDAVGGRRNDQRVNNHSEAINKILSEMDGFKTRENILVMASTNREGVLDRALLRSGRFDSKVYIDMPNKKERVDIYRMYLKKITLSESENIDEMAEKLSKMSPGRSGADIRNICNQAAIIATSQGSTFVKDHNLMEAIDDTGLGIEKKSRKLTDDNLKYVAIHESGHALMGYLLKDGNSPVKLSITPRGYGNLGYTLPMDNEDKIITKEQFLARIYVLMAGRAAELLVFNKITSGAADDFKKVTEILRSMVCELGMYHPYVVYGLDIHADNPASISETKKTEIERFIEETVGHIFEEVQKILRDNIEKLKLLRDKLLDCERIDIDLMREILPDCEDSVDVSC